MNYRVYSGIGLLLCIFVSRVFCPSFCRDLSLVINVAVSEPSYAAMIQEYVQGKKQGFADRDLFVRLKTSFPAIAQCSIAYCPDRNILKVGLFKPLCCINESFVLTENKIVIDKNFFAESVLEHLPHLTVSHEGLSHPDILLLVLQRLLPIVNDSYSLDFVSKDCIRLVHKKDHLFSAICSAEQEISSDMFDYCEKIKGNLVKHEMPNKSTAWIADMRFAHYIIAYKA